jgi:hypothetical protein
MPQFNSILFMFHNIHNRPGFTGKVTSQIKSCTSHRAVIKYKQISVKLDTHYIYTLQEDIYKWFFMTPSVATKSQYINSILFLFSHSLHVSAPTGHPQVRYIIRYLRDYFLIQRIRCTCFSFSYLCSLPSDSHYQHKTEADVSLLMSVAPGFAEFS